MSKTKVVRTEGELRGIARREVMKAVNAKLPSGEKIKISDVAIVWQCWILGNWKAMITTTNKSDLYYEFTYDKSKDRAYLDEYAHAMNSVIKLS